MTLSISPSTSRLPVGRIADDRDVDLRVLPHGVGAQGKSLRSADFWPRDVDFASRNGRVAVEIVSIKCRENVEAM